MGNNWKFCDIRESCHNLQANNLLEFKEKPYPYLYRREYQAGGYDVSEDNQLILNFKMGKDQSPTRLFFRDEAIATIAEDLNEIIAYIATETDSNLCVVYPPTTLEEQDDRFLLLKEQLGIENNIQISFTESITPLHYGGQRKSDTIIPRLKIESYHFNNSGHFLLFFIDDVIASGATFRACIHFLRQEKDFFRNNNVIVEKIYGVFVAKRVDDADS